MKFIILLLLSFTVFYAIADDGQKDAFSIYQEDANRENFLTAYGELGESNNQIFLSYLLYMEMERQLEEIKIEDLKPQQKFMLANLFLELGKYEKSIEIYEKINEATPKWSCPWRHKGEALYKMRNFEQSEVALKKAIETRVEHYDAYIWLAKVQKELGKYKEALQTFETGISYKGKDIEEPEKEVEQLDELFLKLELLKLNKRNKEYKEAKKHLEEIAPDDERLQKF
jgi:tetratricopeptide (TPR) repeat protein